MVCGICSLTESKISVMWDDSILAKSPVRDQMRIYLGYVLFMVMRTLIATLIAHVLYTFATL